MASTAFQTAATKSSGLSLSTMFGAFAAWNDRRQTRKALTALTADQLDDIGLAHGDIETLVRGQLTR